MNYSFLDYCRKSLADSDIASPKTEGKSTYSISENEFLNGHIEQEKAQSLIEFFKKEIGDPKTKITSPPVAITPFLLAPKIDRRKQTQLVRAALKKHRIEETITVGTVHALQDAERKLILFSSVYSKYRDAKEFFFDYDSYMLNVAVSRVKDIEIRN